MHIHNRHFPNLYILPPAQVLNSSLSIFTPFTRQIDNDIRIIDEQANHIHRSSG